MKIKNYIQFIKESNYYNYNNIIDYTLLEESATNEDIIELCRKAALLRVKSVCVLPKMVKLASEQLIESNVLVCTVISFPKGTNSPNQKLSETKQVINDGADEVDMVLSYNKLGDISNEKYLIDEVSLLVRECHSKNNKNGSPIALKVIVESGLLSNEETKTATEICLKSGADFIKTSTGKVNIGAELDKVKIMFDIIRKSGLNMKIKASGGIRTKDQIDEFIPYVDRFGMGYSSVDQINNINSTNTKNNY